MRSARTSNETVRKNRALNGIQEQILGQEGSEGQFNIVLAAERPQIGRELFPFFFFNLSFVGSIIYSLALGNHTSVG